MTIKRLWKPKPEKLLIGTDRLALPLLDLATWIGDFGDSKPSKGAEGVICNGIQ